MTRKSPCKHRVSAHIRKGKSVQSYVRGKGPSAPESRGIPIRKVRKSKVKPGTPKPYTVNFKYSNRKGDGETVVVISTSFDKALKEAWTEKVDPREPIEIEIVDPLLGKALHLIGAGVKKVAEIGGRYAVKGGHIAKQAAIRAAREAGKQTWKGIKVAGKEAVRTAVAVGKEARKELAEQYRSARVKRLIVQAYSPDYKTKVTARDRLRREYPDIYDVMDFSKDRPTRVRRLKVKRPKIIIKKVIVKEKKPPKIPKGLVKLRQLE